MSYFMTSGIRNCSTPRHRKAISVLANAYCSFKFCTSAQITYFTLTKSDHSASISCTPGLSQFARSPAYKQPTTLMTTARL